MRQLVRGDYDFPQHYSVQVLYPHVEWFPWRFPVTPPSFWIRQENQKQFLLWYQQHVKKMKSLDEWYDVTKEQLLEVGGHGFFAMWKGSSLGDILKSHFPEHRWLPWKFTVPVRGFWENKDNLRQYFDWVIEDQQLSGPADLKRKKKGFFVKLYGKPLFEMYNMSQALELAYPGIILFVYCQHCYVTLLSH
jgi:hypothetical protein